MFTFKQFAVDDGRSPLKVTTDAALLGAWVDSHGSHRILDVGTGCGIIALMLAQRTPEASVTGIDLHPGSVADARANAARAPWASRIEIIEGDIFQYKGRRFDLLVCNPPFFNETLRSPDSGRATARHEGTLSPASFIALAPSLLAPGGRLALIAPTDRDAAVSEALTLARLYPRRILRYRQRPGRPLVRTLWEATSTPATEQTRELTISDAAGYTPEYRQLLADFMLRF